MPHSISSFIKKLPTLPGVYLFKDIANEVVYVGKAKNLKNRVSSYLIHQKTDWKAQAILSESESLDHHVTSNELEALMLEAKLIQSHQPKFNTLLKTGQPFIYIMLSNSDIPQLTLVRNKKKRGIYFGPFIEKGPARRVYTFLMNTFRLKICTSHIENGCLYYHLGKCAGSCRSDFDVEGYKQRLELAVTCLKKGHKKFLAEIEEKIAYHNSRLEFEKSQEFAHYLESFDRVFESLSTNFSEHGPARSLFEKDIWVSTNAGNVLVVFKERDGLLKKQQVFYNLFESGSGIEDYFKSYYRTYTPPDTILVSFELEDQKLIESFLQQWVGRSTISIVQPTQGHFANLVRLGEVQADHYAQQYNQGPMALKRLLNLSKAPHTIDCFDISHKQGTFMVGSCIRFKDGQPDKNSFRKFHIKTVEGQDDYASLREIVGRRYRNGDEPDLVLIDGGKGQLNAVKDLVKTDIISLAKREETVFSDQFPEGKKIKADTFGGQLLIALRDYAHHFAISFHRKLASKVTQNPDS